MLRIDLCVALLAAWLVAMTAPHTEAFSVRQLAHRRNHCQSLQSTTALPARPKSKWDLILDEEDEDQQKARSRAAFPSPTT